MNKEYPSFNLSPRRVWIAGAFLFGTACTLSVPIPPDAPDVVRLPDDPMLNSGPVGQSDAARRAQLQAARVDERRSQATDVGAIFAVEATPAPVQQAPQNLTRQATAPANQAGPVIEPEPAPPAPIVQNTLPSQPQTAPITQLNVTGLRP